MPEPGAAQYGQVSGVDHGAREKWAIVWKRWGRSEFRDFLLTFGFSSSQAEAMAKIERALRYGTVAPRRSPEKFRELVEGGDLLLVPVHHRVRIYGVKDLVEPWKLLW